MTRYSPTQIVKAIKSADSAFKSKDYAKAIIRYKKAVVMDPDQPITWFRLGISFYFSGNILEAIRSYERAFKLEKHYEIAINLGLAYLGIKDYERAEKAFSQALQYDESPKNSKTKGEINLQLGRTLLAKGDYKKSLKALEKSENCENPPLLLINYFKGENFLFQNKIEQAIFYYQKTLKIDDGFKDSVIRLVLIYLEKQEKEDALKLLTSFLKKHPESSPDLWNIRGDIHNSMNDYSNAHFAYNQALKYTESDKEELSARIGVIKSLLGQKNYIEAEKEIEILLNSDSKNIDGLALKSELYWLQNDKLKAIEFFEDNVIFHFPDNESALLKLAEYYLQAKLYEKAIILLEKLLKTHPKDFNININLAQIFTDDSHLNPEKAAKYTKKALSIAKSEKENANAYFTIGKLAFKTENNLDAENNLKKALKFDDSHIFAGIFLAKAYLKQAKTDELKIFLSEFLNSHPSYKEIFQADIDLNHYINEISNK
jgi:tetratricopeptide (TPR) repeat protein